jgi:hypothetical protein
METSFSFAVIWSLYPACSGQATPSAFGLFGLAKTEEYFLKNKSNEDYEVIEKALNIRSTPQYGKINQILA